MKLVIRPLHFHKRAISRIILVFVVTTHNASSSHQKTTFTLSELNALKLKQNSPPGITKKNSATTLGNLPSNASLPTCDNIFWWQLFPTTGLHAINPSLPLIYPYLPHAYSLEELAPSLGKGIKVTLIDTGIFGFTFSTPTKAFVTHPDLTLTGDFLHEPHNTIPFEGKNTDPFKNLATFIVHHTQEDRRDIKKVYRLLPVWILEYLTKKSTTALDTYLQEHGSSDLFERNILFFLSSKKLFSAEGKRVKNTILLGDHGFSQFTLATLASGQKVVAECIPMASLATPTPMTDHATHIASIIGARPPHSSTMLDTNTEFSGLYGIAPQCSLRVIKALYEGRGTTTDVHHVTHALERASDYHTDIVNLSLKLDDTVDPCDPLFKTLEKTLATFPYACCATGNEGTKKPGRMSYPARFKNVPFSVGSFGCFYDKKTNQYSCPLSNFSQYEKERGPSFVAPGENILGCSFAYDKKEPLYALKSGTSCATACMSGALALILGEFKNDFSYSQILTVCQASCFKLHATKEWKEHVIYGVLDIRTALFTFHALKKIKSLMSSQLFESQFPLLLADTHAELFAAPVLYGKKQGIVHSFKESFIDYYNEARRYALSPDLQKQLTVPLATAIDALVTNVRKKNSFLSHQ